MAFYKMMKHFAVFFLAYVLAFSVQAESLYSKTYEHCIDRSEGVTSNILDCIGTEYNRFDKALNATYKKLMKTLGKGDQERLRQAQRAWLKYHESNSAYIQNQGGTMASIEASSWELEELVRRVHFLQGELQKNQ